MRIHKDKKQTFFTVRFRNPDFGMERLPQGEQTIDLATCVSKERDTPRTAN